MKKIYILFIVFSMTINLALARDIVTAKTKKVKIEYKTNTYSKGLVNDDFIVETGENYTFFPQRTSYHTCRSFVLDLVKKSGEHYTYKKVDRVNLLSITYNPNDLPSNEEWQTDPKTGYIIGYIKYNGVDKSSNYNLIGVVKVLFSKPNNKQAKENAFNNQFDLKLNYEVVGATKNIIRYSRYGSSMIHQVQDDEKRQLFKVIEELDKNEKYSVSIKAINYSGVFNDKTFDVGNMVYPLGMVVRRNGNNIKYRFKLKDKFVDDKVTILDAGIYNTRGVKIQSLPKIPNCYHKLNKLTRGVYVIKVTVRGYGTSASGFFYR